MSASGWERIASTARAVFPSTSPILQLSCASSACIASSFSRGHATPCADRTRVGAGAQDQLVDPHPLVGGVGPSEVAGSEGRARDSREAGEERAVVGGVDPLRLRVHADLGRRLARDREYLLAGIDLRGWVVRRPGP